jgi:surface protein
VREVTDMRSLFYGCKALNELNLRSFITTKCHIFDDMFAECNEMNVTIYRNQNPELIESAPYYINFLESMKLQGFLFDE